MLRRAFICRVAPVLLLASLSCRYFERPETVTDDPQNRAAAAAEANRYLESHRAELVPGSKAPVLGTHVFGGTLRGKSKTAFAVRLAFATEVTRNALGKNEAESVWVYMIAGEPPRVIGAQAQSPLGVVLGRIGGRLDKDFTGRD
jgi:hypothetical protein